MRALLAVSLTLGLAASAQAQFSAPPVSTDAFDVAQGAAVTGETPGINPSGDAAIGANPGGPEPGTCFFPDIGIGNVGFIEFSTNSPVAVSAVRIYGKNDGAAAAFRRAMSAFSLLADTDGDGSFETTAVSASINPNYDQEPANLAIQSEYLELLLTFSPLSADAWRLEFTQGAQIGQFEGIRVIEVDGLIGTCPPPVSYCTAGTTSSGCHATMGSAGTPSLSNFSPFTLTCTNTEGNKNGVFFYSITGRNASPWGINGTSFLCVKSPTQRMNPVLGSGGTAGQCDGSYAVDWNAFVAANPNKAINQALVTGTLVTTQVWFRDPASGTGPVGAKGTALSDGLEFTVCP
jgi:hypothetical protein